jgi:ATP-dependent DNA helicase RecQ
VFIVATWESGGVAPREIPASAVPPISPEQAAAVRSLVAEGRPSLRTPRQLARFLCGLTSPATTRERLGRHAAFGVLARVPFAEVLEEQFLPMQRFESALHALLAY